MSFLYLAIHYPKKEHRQELLGAMHQLDKALGDAAGLQVIGAWADVMSDRILAISIWESQQAFQDALGKFSTGVTGVPFDQWEERPRELIRAEEIKFLA
jgi:hypothetical protein